MARLSTLSIGVRAEVSTMSIRRFRQCRRFWLAGQFLSPCFPCGGEPPGAFVDNVDTRARIKKRLALFFLLYRPLARGFSPLTRAYRHCRHAYASPLGGAGRGTPNGGRCSEQLYH